MRPSTGIFVAVAILITTGAHGAHVTPSVIATIPLNGYPQCVTVNSATNRIYTHHWQPSAVTVIDGSTHGALATVPVDGYSWRGCMGVNPTTNRIYVALTFNSNNFIHSGQNALVVIDGGTSQIIATTDVGRGAMGVGVNTVTNRIYVSNFYGASVSVIDGATNTPLAAIPVGSRPESAAVNETTNRVYVTSSDTRALWVIDGATNAVIATIPFSDAIGQPVDATVNPNTNLVYVTHYQTRQISIIDGTTHAILGTIPLTVTPVAIRMNPATDHLYVTDIGSTVTVVDAGTRSVVATVQTGGERAEPLAVNDVTDRVYVGNFFSRTLAVLGDNELPVAVDDLATTTVNSAVTINVLANDSDGDGDPLSVVSVSQGAYGAVTVNGNGSVTYTPSCGFLGQDSFTYSVSDRRGGTDTATVTVTVEAGRPSDPGSSTPPCQPR